MRDCTRTSATLMPRIIGTDPGRRSLNRLLAFGFQRVIQRRQILCEELIELFRYIVEFAAKSVDVCDLICGRFAFVTKNCSVKLVGVLSQSFFAGDRPAFGRCDNFLSNSVYFSLASGALL